MSLLREIQHAASDSTVLLPDVLRKCLILSDRLDYGPLSKWVKQELDGYSELEDLPDYRVQQAADVICKVQRGNTYLGPVTVARSAVPEGARELLYTIPLYEGVAALLELLEGDQQLAIPVDTAWGQIIVQNMYPGAACIEMKRIITRSQITGVLDTVRTRILEFALQIERERPDAGDVGSGEAPVSEEKLESAFQVIVGDASSVNIAVNSPGASQLASVNQGDFESLARVLRTVGVDDESIGELRGALTEDENEAGPNQVGPRTRRWLERLQDQIAAGAIQLATAEGLKLVIKAIFVYATGDPGGDSGMTLA